MEKITKGMARKLYDSGKEVMIIPNKIRPNSILAFWTSKPNDDPDATFDKLCNGIFYYNCSPETGMKLVYYAKEI